MTKTIPEIVNLIDARELDPDEWEWNVQGGDIVIEKEDEVYGRIELNSDELAKKVLSYLGIC